VIPHDTVSSQHAEIVFREGAFYLRDLRSRNGTFVNGKQISRPEEAREVILRARDRIRFDAYEYEFKLEALAGAAQTRLASPAAVQPPEDLRTKKKADMCPRHPAWKATELCGECRTAYCKQCMREREEGKPICVACLEKTPSGSS
jgi:pSer/pThr/pTyr-binding forkhead associated (FHA) protein